MEFLIEIFLEVFGEALIELSIAALGEYTAHRSPRVFLASLGGMLFGVAIGFFTLWPLPNHLIHDPSIRLACLVLNPLLVGFLLGARGWLGRERVFRFASFFSGLLLAAALGTVRYIFASE